MDAPRTTPMATITRSRRTRSATVDRNGLATAPGARRSSATRPSASRAQVLPQRGGGCFAVGHHRVEARGERAEALGVGRGGRGVLDLLRDAGHRPGADDPGGSLDAVRAAPDLLGLPGGQRIV